MFFELKLDCYKFNLLTVETNIFPKCDTELHSFSPSEYDII